VALTLDAIRACLEGGVPSTVATCAADGTPNVSVVSQVHYVDRGHVALSFQFFNKTRQNVLANPRAAALVIEPETAGQYRLELEYLRTETEGPLFENMKAKLAGIASHTGMSGVFKLQGADVYEVLDVEHLAGPELPPPLARRGLLGAVRSVSSLLAAATDLHTVLDEVLAILEVDMGIAHSMVLLVERSRARLYTVASRGYAASGVGSEIPLGNGIITVNTDAQAWARARASELNKGGDAARAALAMLRIKRRLTKA